MGLEHDWLQLGSTTIAWVPLSTYDADGSPLYAASTTLTAIVHQNRRNIFFADGRVETSRTLIFILSTSVHIGNEDQLFEAPTTGTKDPVRILSVDHVDDEQGQHHVEVVCG